MDFEKITEHSSNYNNLEHMTINELLFSINKEDSTVPSAVNKAIPQIEILVSEIVKKLKDGGRLFYIGSGTSGRLGIVDASECPPTFGVSNELVIGIIAGGDKAIRKAVEHAEDSFEQGWSDLKLHHITNEDIVIGIAASGTTPYVLGALENANKHGIITGCITMNEGSPLSKLAKYPIVVTVGPEFVTGSSRMKAGTAQKLVLNMISTATMIQLGRVVDNKMVDMQLTNHKLIERGSNMIVEELKIDFEEAKNLLLQHGSVRAAIANYKYTS